MNDFLDLLLLASFLVGGIYSVVTAVQMKHWQTLQPNKFLYPNGCEPGDCSDQAGFRDFMQPRILAFGILCFVTALAFVGGTYLSFCPDWAVWVAFLVGVGAVILYISAIRRAYIRYW